MLKRLVRGCICKRSQAAILDNAFNIFILRIEIFDSIFVNIEVCNLRRERKIQIQLFLTSVPIVRSTMFQFNTENENYHTRTRLGIHTHTYTKEMSSVTKPTISDGDNDFVTYRIRVAPSSISGGNYRRDAFQISQQGRPRSPWRSSGKG